MNPTKRTITDISADINAINTEVSGFENWDNCDYCAEL